RGAPKRQKTPQIVHLIPAETVHFWTDVNTVSYEAGPPIRKGAQGKPAATRNNNLSSYISKSDYFTLCEISSSVR
ncbi:MAG: hypothetical protein AAB359_09865, partial [Elusimicrobiota bacterium]